MTQSDYIKCYFDSNLHSVQKFNPQELKVFYAETTELSSRYSDLRNCISADEQLRADKFVFNSDRETYTVCHAVLRLILAKELNVNPLDLLFIQGNNNKPGLSDDSAFFNITHTREAFAIAISRHYYVGIDLEKLDFSLNFHSIIKTFFSLKERQFILQSDSDAVNRFFLLWTRKEALLKALGTGIMDILTHIEVSEQENFLDKELFETEVIESACNEHFIYSMVMGNNYLSIAAPYNAILNINHLDNETVLSFLELKNIL